MYPHKYTKVLNHSREMDVNHSDDDGNETGDESNAAQNLLGFKNNSSGQWRPPSSLTSHPTSVQSSAILLESLKSTEQQQLSSADQQAKSDGSIVRLYQPKFIEVLMKYAECTNQNVDVSRHLLWICLDHLINFSCWARESTNRSNWIKKILEENTDLRPEVRNGLAMILMYCVSAAKANTIPDSDMFIVLQDNDNGLGIVNKTSLKIYNDPFNYFNFLKACITGLIDAGKIPENERQNQPKKLKRQVENKEEILAYLQMKSILTNLLAKGDQAQLRVKVTQISNFWNQKQKNVRSHRFVAALAILNAPTTLPVTKAPIVINAPIITEYDTQTSSIQSLLSNMIGVNTATNVAWQSMESTNNNSNSNNNNNINNTNNALPASASHLYASTQLLSGSSAVKGSKATNSSNGNNGAHMDATDTPHEDSDLSSEEEHSEEVDSVNANQRAATAPRSSTSSPINSKKRPIGAVSHGYHHGKSSGHESMHREKLRSVSCDAFARLKSPRASKVVRSPINCIRFERIGCKEWQFRYARVYDLDSLASNELTAHCSFSLIDESKLTAVDLSNQQLKSGLSGSFVSLHTELQKRGALLTSWPRAEQRHMFDFLLAYNEEAQESDLTLLEFWRKSGCAMENATLHRHAKSSEDRTAGEDQSGVRARGTIIYETILHIGLVVRANPTLGIHEDCWRLFYPQDMEEAAAQSVCFGDFLVEFFPQLLCLQSPAQAAEEKTSYKRGVIVKYLPQPMDMQQTVQQPPSKVSCETYYQTIGTLQALTANILARFDTSSFYFHDIILYKQE